MRIGVDGRVLSLLPTGLALYAQNMLRAMLAMSAHRWHVYTPGPLRVELPHDPRVTIESSMLNHPRMFTPWQQFVLPFKVARSELDLFWSPHHYLPWLPRDLPAVCTIHDLVWATCPEDMHVIRRRLESVLMPWAIRRSHTVVAVSQSTAEQLYRHIPAARGKTTVIHHGLVALPQPTANSAAALGVMRPFILFVGTIQKRKNLARLLVAYRRLPQSLREEFDLVIAGASGWGADVGGPDSRDSDRVGRVHFLGYVPRERLAGLYREANVFAMPSLEEGFGFPLLEAMASGTAILASSGTALAEVAGDAAVLVDPHDEAAIARGLERLLGDAGLRAQLAASGERRLRDFSWDKAARQLLAVFDKTQPSRRWLR